MQQLFDLIHDYQRLRAALLLEVPLDDAEEARIEGLRRMLQGELTDAGGRRSMPRVGCDLLARITCIDGFVDAHVRDLSGEGIALEAARPIEVGAEVLIHLEIPATKSEYTFPARACWRRGRLVGLAFEGIPSRGSRISSVPPQSRARRTSHLRLTA